MLIGLSLVCSDLVTPYALNILPAAALGMKGAIKKAEDLVAAKGKVTKRPSFTNTGLYYVFNFFRDRIV